MGRYFVICSFDLKNADTSEYEKAYSLLGSIGLERVVKSDSGGNVVMPTTTVAGQIEGSSASDAARLTATTAQGLFTRYRLRAELFVVAAEDWAWSARTS